VDKVHSLYRDQVNEGYADKVLKDKIFYVGTSSADPLSVAALRGVVGGGEKLRDFENGGVSKRTDQGDFYAVTVAEEGEGTVLLWAR
jgi:hypothetical protein